MSILEFSSCYTLIYGMDFDSYQGEMELVDLGLMKEKMEISFRDEQSRVGILIEAKGNTL